MNMKCSGCGDKLEEGRMIVGNLGFCLDGKYGGCYGTYKRSLATQSKPELSENAKGDSLADIKET